jgi:O-antigen ligase
MRQFMQRLPDSLHRPGPTETGWRKYLAPSEFAFLLLFAFFLPLREAPKTIFLALYVVTWLVNRTPTRNFGGPWKLWDSITLAPLASGVLAAAFAGIRTPSGREWLALNDPLMQAALLLCLWRGRYGVAQWKTLFVMLLFSCVIAELEGLWLWKIRGYNQSLQLKSVGHVNHSAVYLTIMSGLAFAFAIYSTQRCSLVKRIIFFGAFAMLLAGVLTSDSRAAVGTELVMIGILCLVAYLWLPIRKTWLTMLLIIVAAATMVLAQGTIQKQQIYARANNQLSYRDKIWNRGFTAWRANPIFGIGVGNFGEISDARISEWLETRGETFNHEKYFLPFSHAHNLFVNTLAERGIIGLFSIVLFLGYWGWGLAKSFTGRNRSTEQTLFWGASFSSWFTISVVGLANTTLHHEHALVSIVLVAGWRSWQKISLREFAQQNTSH